VKIIERDLGRDCFSEI